MQHVAYPTDQKFMTKAQFARFLQVSNPMVRKYQIQGRLVMDPTGKLVDVAASEALIRSSRDPSRGGKGGYSAPSIARAMQIAPSAKERADEAWRGVSNDFDADPEPEPPELARILFPAPREFHAIADYVRKAAVEACRLTLEKHSAGGYDMVIREFDRWLLSGTAGLAALIHAKVEAFLRPHIRNGSVQ